jgi:hypothetical protein
MIRLVAASICLACGLAAAQGKPIYKCGPDGKTYSQVPCAEGKLLESSDPRTAAQRAEARRLEARQREEAAKKERERLAAEKAAKADAAKVAASAAEPPPPIPEATAASKPAPLRVRAK